MRHQRSSIEYTPNVLWPAMDELAIALVAAAEEPNSVTGRKAQRAYARVDWVESEVDPDTIQGKYLESLFQLGKYMGLRTLEELSEEEVKFFGIFDDL